MSDIASLIRQTTADLVAVQNAMQPVGNEPDGAKAGVLDKVVNPELVKQLKATIDRTRQLLWLSGQSGVLEHLSEQVSGEAEDSRLQLVSKFLWLLSRTTAPGDSTQEETMSFFERIDSISDRLLAEHPENKKSKAA